MGLIELKVSHFQAQADDVVIETTIGSILRDKSDEMPDEIAVLEPALMPAAEDRRLTYRELLRESERLARALLSRFKPGERVAIWSQNSLEWVVFEFAASLAGLVVVTVNPSFQARELKFLLTQSGAVALFAVDECRGNPIWKIASEVVSELPAVRELTHLSDHEALFKGENTLCDFPPVKPDDAALIIYTSGTTGIPKGAVLSHRGVTNNSRMMFARLDARGPLITATPLFHVGGILALLGCVQHGNELIQLSAFDPVKVLALVESESAAAVTGVPTMLFALLDQQEARNHDVSSLKRLMIGGSMVSPEVVRRTRSVLGCNVQTIYGQTECHGVLSQTYNDDATDDICETVGQALPAMEISIRSPAGNEVVPVGQVGEICARGYGVMIGYNQNPEMTAEAIDKDNWLHTGDLGTMDSRGYIRITGRVKEVIIRGGENIYPVEIENVLLEHASISEVAVVGVPDERWGEVVAAFVRLKPGAAFDSSRLVEHCRAQISPQKTPSKWIQVESFPLTGSGKIQKFVLRDRFVAGDFN